MWINKHFHTLGRNINYYPNYPNLLQSFFEGQFGNYLLKFKIFLSIYLISPLLGVSPTENVPQSAKRQDIHCIIVGNAIKLEMTQLLTHDMLAK